MNVRSYSEAFGVAVETPEAKRAKWALEGRDSDSETEEAVLHQQLSLPRDAWEMIIGNVGFKALEQLRQSCKYFHLLCSDNSPFWLSLCQKIGLVREQIIGRRGTLKQLLIEKLSQATGVQAKNAKSFRAQWKIFSHHDEDTLPLREVYRSLWAYNSQADLDKNFQLTETLAKLLISTPSALTSSERENYTLKFFKYRSYRIFHLNQQSKAWSLFPFREMGSFSDSERLLLNNISSRFGLLKRRFYELAAAGATFKDYKEIYFQFKEVGDDKYAAKVELIVVKHLFLKQSFTSNFDDLYNSFERIRRNSHASGRDRVAAYFFQCLLIFQYIRLDDEVSSLITAMEKLSADALLDKAMQQFMKILIVNLRLRIANDVDGDRRAFLSLNEEPSAASRSFVLYKMLMHVQLRISGWLLLSDAQVAETLLKFTDQAYLDPHHRFMARFYLALLCSEQRSRQYSDSEVEWILKDAVEGAFFSNREKINAELMLAVMCFQGRLKENFWSREGRNPEGEIRHCAYDLPLLEKSKEQAVALYSLASFHLSGIIRSSSDARAEVQLLKIANADYLKNSKLQLSSLLLLAQMCYENRLSEQYREWGPQELYRQLPSMIYNWPNEYGKGLILIAKLISKGRVKEIPAIEIIARVKHFLRDPYFKNSAEKLQASLWLIQMGEISEVEAQTLLEDVSSEPFP